MHPSHSTFFHGYMYIYIYDIFGYVYGYLMPPPSMFKYPKMVVFPQRRDVFAARYLQSFWRPCHRWGKEHETGEWEFDWP